MSLLQKRWPKILILLIGVVLHNARFTDADLLDVETIPDNLLRATTLDFSNNKTSNELPLTNFFNVSGLLSNGFEVETLRIKRDGEMDFAYQLSTQNISGSQALCDSLIITIMKNWTTVYEGSLQNVSYADELNAVRHQDLVFVVKTNGSGQGLGNQGCYFEFLIATDFELEETAFHDEEVLQNQIISGIF